MLTVTLTGTANWTCPAGVTTLTSVFLYAGGGGGGGGSAPSGQGGANVDPNVTALSFSQQLVLA